MSDMLQRAASGRTCLSWALSFLLLSHAPFRPAWGADQKPGALFSQELERTVLEYLLKNNKADAEEFQAQSRQILSAQNPRKASVEFYSLWKSRVAQMLGSYLAFPKPYSGLAQWLKHHEIHEEDLLAYYCPKLAAIPLETSYLEDRKILRQLLQKEMAGQKALKASLEEASILLDFEQPAQIYGRCIQWSNAHKVQRAYAQASLAPGPNTLKTKPVPETGPRKEIRETNRKNALFDSANLEKTLLGASFGALAFGLLGLVWAGPFGLFTGALFGSLLMGAVAHVKNEQTPSE